MRVLLKRHQLRSLSAENSHRFGSLRLTDLKDFSVFVDGAATGIEFQ